jgi:hypothetical protein
MQTACAPAARNVQPNFIDHVANPHVRCTIVRVGDVESLGERFMRERVLVRCKPSTQREYRRALMLFINRKLGRRRVAEVARADISEIHHA